MVWLSEINITYVIMTYACLSYCSEKQRGYGVGKMDGKGANCYGNQFLETLF